MTVRLNFDQTRYRLVQTRLKLAATRYALVATRYLLVTMPLNADQTIEMCLNHFLFIRYLPTTTELLKQASHKSSLARR